MAAEQLPVVIRTRAKEQQILELVAITVIQHLAQQSIGHGIARAAGELVEYLILGHDGHVNAVNGTMQVGETVGLFKERVRRDDEEVGNLHGMQILICHRLKARNLLQGL